MHSREKRTSVFSNRKSFGAILAVLLLAVTITPSSTAQDFQLATDNFEIEHDQVFESGTVSVLDNDPTLPDGRLIVRVTREPLNGLVTMSPDGTFTYVPDSGYLGDDSFDYIVEFVPLQVLTFVENSSLDLDAKVTVSSLGSDTDSQAVPIIGTAWADIGPVGIPVERVQIIDIDVLNRDEIGLKFDYTVLTIRINLVAEALQLRLNSVGPFDNTAPPLGFFEQKGNKLGLNAVVDVEGSGLLGDLVPSGQQILTTETDFDLSGFIVNQTGTITLILIVDSQNQFDLDGNAVDMGITGQISATGPHLPGAISSQETVNLRVISPAAIADTEIPGPFRLHGVYPNPITTTATIEFELDRSTNVRLTIYDILGREVHTLPVGIRHVGRNNLQWDASNLTRGIYLLRMSTETQTHTRTVVVQ